MKVHVYYNSLIPNLFGAVGITFGRYVFISLSEEQAKDYGVFNHEMVHVKQIADTGIIKWYFQYFRDFFKFFIKKGVTRREAYLSIPAEVEAYNKQDSFEPPKEWDIIEK
jgi:hypothetical protein